MKLKSPESMTSPFVPTLMENDEDRVDGVVEKVNIAPSSLGIRELSVSLEVTEKSAATPVVAPKSSETLMVHTTASPVRAGLMFVHDRLDSVVGLP